MLKVMFTCAVCRPRDGWDGKIGVYALVEYVKAKRTTKYYKRGEYRLVSMSVMKDVYREVLTKQILNDLKKKWPSRRDRRIKIQHDGATCHIKNDDAKFRAYCAEHMQGWDIEIVVQPARSPDLNVLDLGFFSSLQTLQWSYDFPDNCNALVANVLRAYDKIDCTIIDKCFVTLQTVLDEVLKCCGNNNYKILHIRKDQIIREKGSLPQNYLASKPEQAASQRRRVTGCSAASRASPEAPDALHIPLPGRRS